MAGNLHKMKKGVLVFLLIFMLSGIHSIGQELSFKRFGTPDGLSNGWVRCFYQDNYGFIWIGTSDGLNRYDGKNFKVYRPSNDKGIPLGNVTINDIITKDDTTLWIATDMGLFSLNMIDEKMVFDPFLSAHPVLTIVKDMTNTFWFGTNHGLIEYNAVMQTKTTYSANGNNNLKICDDYITSIAAVSNNNLWVGTKNGLMLYNRSKRTFDVFRKNGTQSSISGNYISCICEDQQQRVWIGTALDGLNLAENTSDGYVFKTIVNGAISDLYADRMNRLWVGHSTNSGIQLIDLTTLGEKQLTVRTVRNNPFENKSISDNAISCFFEDRLHDLWVGTFGNGLNFYSPIPFKTAW